MFQVNPNQALFSLKDKSNKLKCRLLQFLFGPLRVSLKDKSNKLKCRLLQFLFGPLRVNENEHVHCKASLTTSVFSH